MDTEGDIQYAGLWQSEQKECVAALITSWEPFWYLA